MTQTGKCPLKLWQQKYFQCEMNPGCFFPLTWNVFTAKHAEMYKLIYLGAQTWSVLFGFIIVIIIFGYALKRYAHRNVKFRPNVFVMCTDSLARDLDIPHASIYSLLLYNCLVWVSQQIRYKKTAADCWGNRKDHWCPPAQPSGLVLLQSKETGR